MAVCLQVACNEYCLRLPQYLRLFQVVAEKTVTANLTAALFTYVITTRQGWSGVILITVFNECIWLDSVAVPVYQNYLLYLM